LLFANRLLVSLRHLYGSRSTTLNLIASTNQNCEFDSYPAARGPGVVKAGLAGAYEGETVSFCPNVPLVQAMGQKKPHVGSAICNPSKRITPDPQLMPG
jgi:hypothetical protein